MMQRVFRRCFAFGLRVEKVIETNGARLRRAVHVGLLAVLDDRVRHDVRDLLLGGAYGQRKLGVVTLAPDAIAQYAAGMIDEAKRFFDVSLSVTRLGVILSDQPTQRRAHLLVGGARLNSQRFVERGLHSLVDDKVRLCDGRRSFATFWGKQEASRQNARSFRRFHRTTTRRPANRAVLSAASELRARLKPRYSDLALSRLASFSRIRADLPERSRK